MFIVALCLTVAALLGLIQSGNTIRSYHIARDWPWDFYFLDEAVAMAAFDDLNRADPGMPKQLVSYDIGIERDDSASWMQCLVLGCSHHVTGPRSRRRIVKEYWRQSSPVLD